MIRTAGPVCSLTCTILALAVTGCGRDEPAPAPGTSTTKGGLTGATTTSTSADGKSTTETRIGSGGVAVTRRSTSDAFVIHDFRDKPDAAQTGTGTKPAGQGRAAADAALRSVPSGLLLADHGFERNWEVELPGKVEGSWILPELPELLFVQIAPTHAILAIDAMSGAARWSTVPLNKTVDPRQPPSAARTSFRVQGKGTGTYATVQEDRLYVIIDDTLFSFDAGIDDGGGQIVWRYRMPFTPSGGPLATGGDANLRLFLPDFDRRIQVLTSVPHPRVLWQYNLQALPVHAPVERDGLVYLGDQGGTMRCFKLDREQVWEFHAGGAFTGAPAVRDRVLFAGNDDNILWALSRLSGDELGHLNFNGPIHRAPLLFKSEPQRVYCFIDDPDPAVGGLVAVKAVPDSIPFTEKKDRYPREVVRMAVEWRVGGLDRAIGSTPEHLLCSSGTSLLVSAVNRQSGAIDWQWDPINERRAAAAAAKVDLKAIPEITHLTAYHDGRDLNRSVYFADAKGRLSAWRLFGYRPGDALARPSEAPIAAAPAAPSKAPADKAPAKAPAPAK